MRFLLLLFVITPLIEIVLLIEIGSQIGALVTIAWLVVAAILGTLLIRLQGIATLMRARDMVGQGKAPAAALAHGLLFACAGVLLIIPGFATDAVALLLLIPASRKMLIRQWSRKVRVSTGFSGNIYDARSPVSEPKTSPESTGKAGRTLEGEFKREE